MKLLDTTDWQFRPYALEVQRSRVADSTHDIEEGKEAPHDATDAITHGIMLSVLCVISFYLITHILARMFSVSRDDDLLGGMWAVVATIFVYRYGYEQTTAAALSRMAATLLSFVLCLVYLLFFPFDVWGMAALIGFGAAAMVLLGRPEDVITTGITTAVVMVVAAISPEHAWKQPIFRVVDTCVGAGIGIIGATTSWLLSARDKPVR